MTDSAPIKLLPWTFGKRHYDLGATPLIMGIVNVTPDSFSDGGKYLDADLAVEQAMRLVEEGADILDLGGESTRPGSLPVPLQQELDRLLPVVEKLAKSTSVPISIDTNKAEVARQCLQAGAEIINDISGLTFDAQMPEVCREFQAGIVCMHIQGTPATMQIAPTYQDCVGEIQEWLESRLAFLAEQGIAATQTLIDPGIGFGKTADHNVLLLSSIQQFRSTGRPVLIGHSRKGFLKQILGRELDQRFAGTIGVAVALAAQKTDVIRVHDVAAIKDAITAWQVIMANVKS